MGRQLRSRLGRAEAWIRNAALGRSAVHLLSAVGMTHEAVWQNRQSETAPGAKSPANER